MTEAQTEDIGRPVKRPRLENYETPYKRDLEFWFADGSIISISQEGSVHQGVLARHCEFFSDMFVLARPEQKDRKGVR